MMILLFDEEWIAKMHDCGLKEGLKEGELITIRNKVKKLSFALEQTIAAAGIPDSEK